jgi:hypothetical protein
MDNQTCGQLTEYVYYLLYDYSGGFQLPIICVGPDPTQPPNAPGFVVTVAIQFYYQATANQFIDVIAPLQVRQREGGLVHAMGRVGAYRGGWLQPGTGRRGACAAHNASSSPPPPPVWCPCLFRVPPRA